MSADFIFSIAILVFSVIVHEVSHGYAAYLQGDTTAQRAGRLTLNPIPHIDLFGSIILPAFLALTGVPIIIGWAKPVPFNPYNLRNHKWGEAIVAVAGPLSNIALALIFGLGIRFGLFDSFGDGFIYISSTIVFINLALATFNLIPIPPLDGSKILFSFLPYSAQGMRAFLEKNGFVILIFFVLFLSQFLSPVVIKEFTWITGLSV